MKKIPIIPIKVVGEDAVKEWDVWKKKKKFEKKKIFNKESKDYFKKLWKDLTEYEQEEIKERIFFIERFNKSPESDLLYFKEWQRRLKTYEPQHLWNIMDSVSRRVYLEVYGDKAKFTWGEFEE